MSCCSADDEPIKRKIVIVGDGACGKTSLLARFTKGEFPEGDYIPTIFDNTVKDVIVDSRMIHAELWDTAGQEDYDRLRTLSYPDSDVVIIAFSVDIRESLDNILVKWMPEVKRFCPGLPLLLVACKIDLRNDLEKEAANPIKHAEGAKLAKEIGAGYIECSALSGEGVTEVFHSAIRSTIMKTSSCTIM